MYITEELGTGHKGIYPASPLPCMKLNSHPYVLILAQVTITVYISPLVQLISVAVTRRQSMHMREPESLGGRWSQYWQEGDGSRGKRGSCSPLSACCIRYRFWEGRGNRNERSCDEAEIHKAYTGHGIAIAAGAPYVFEVCERL